MLSSIVNLCYIHNALPAHSNCKLSIMPPLRNIVRKLHSITSSCTWYEVTSYFLFTTSSFGFASSLLLLLYNCSQSLTAYQVTNDVFWKVDISTWYRYAIHACRILQTTQSLPLIGEV
jgi:hypothetical protein